MSQSQEAGPELTALGVIALLGGSVTWHGRDDADAYEGASQAVVYPGGVIALATLRKLSRASLVAVTRTPSYLPGVMWAAELTAGGRDRLPDLPALAPPRSPGTRDEAVNSPALGRDLLLVLRHWHDSRDPRLPALLRALRAAGWGLSPLAQALGLTTNRIGQLSRRPETDRFGADDLPPVPNGKRERRSALTQDESAELTRLDRAVRDAPDDLAVRVALWETIAAYCRRGNLEWAITGLLRLPSAEVQTIRAAMGIARTIKDIGALIDPAWSHWLNPPPEPEQQPEEQPEPDPERLAWERDIKGRSEHAATLLTACGWKPVRELPQRADEPVTCRCMRCGRTQEITLADHYWPGSWNWPLPVCRHTGRTVHQEADAQIREAARAIRHWDAVRRARNAGWEAIGPTPHAATTVWHLRCPTCGRLLDATLRGRQFEQPCRHEDTPEEAAVRRRLADAGWDIVRPPVRGSAKRDVRCTTCGRETYRTVRPRGGKVTPCDHGVRAAPPAATPSAPEPSAQDVRLTGWYGWALTLGSNPAASGIPVPCEGDADPQSAAETLLAERGLKISPFGWKQSGTREYTGFAVPL